MYPEKIFSSKYKNLLSSELNAILDITLEKNETHLYSDEVYKTINSNSVYNYEKNKCNLFRFVFTLNVYASNVLFNITSTDSFQSATEARVYIEEEETYTFSEEEILTEKNGWFGYLTGLAQNEGCSKNFFRPYPTDLNLISNNGFNNYDIFLTYEYDKTDEILFNGIPLSNGIAIYSSSTVSIDNREMTKIVTPVFHNLNEGDEITIFYNSTSINYFVYRIGDEKNNYKQNMFIIDVLNILPSLPTASLKRIANGIYSEYYITKHRKLLQNPLIHKNAFSNTIYEDIVFSVNFKNDLEIEEGYNAFNLPINDIFLTIVKKRHTEYENFFFTSLKSGLYTIYANSDYDITTLSDVLGTPLENNISLDEMYGNLVEYNKIEQRVYYLENIYHRFNSINRSNNGYHEGYYYKPHYKINVRSFSEYVTETNAQRSAPDYAYQFNENRYIYRQLEDNSAANLWPYTNNAFYVYDNIKFFLRRQDPCFEYGSGNLNPIKGNCADFVDKKFNIVENPC